MGVAPGLRLCINKYTVAGTPRKEKGDILMRLVIYTGIFLFIFGTAWVLYLEHQNKKFIETFPNSPVVQPTKIVPHTAGSPYLIEPADSQHTYATEPLVDLTPEPPHVHEHRSIFRHRHDEENQDLTRLVDDNLDEKLSEDLSLAPPPDPVEFDLERIRQGLIHEFGDIPEIDIVLQNMPPALQDGQVVRVERRTNPGAVLEYHKAIAHLWPTPENLMAVERTKELMEWRGGPLPSWVDPEKVRHTDE